MSGVLANADLTAQQTAFVEEVLSGKPVFDAALAAGYSHGKHGSQLVRLPHIAAAIHFEIQRRLVSELAPLAYSVGLKLIQDEASGARVRADLVTKFMAMAGHGAREGKNVGPDKPLSEMTAAELNQYIEDNKAEIAKLESERANRAKPVNAPNPTTIDAKPLTYLD